MSAIAQTAAGALRHLADPAVRALLVAAVAGIVLRLLRMRQASLRLGVWKGVLYAAIALPFLGVFLPQLSLRLPAEAAVFAPPAGPSFRSVAILPATWAPAPVHAARLRLPATGGPPARDRSIPWTAIALSAYGLVSAFLLGQLVMGLFVGRGISHRSHPIGDPAARLALDTQSRALGLRHAPRLVQSSSVAVPLTLGVLVPAIIFPGDWREWPSAKLAAVLAHELAHVRRKDALTRILSLSYRCFFWFSPLAWWLHHHLADLAEQASDEEAIAAGIDPARYAEVLMSFLKAMNRVRGRVRLQGVSMARGARARRRIENVLAAPVRVPAKLRRPLVVLLAASAAAAVTLVAAVHPVVASASAAPPAGTNWTFGNREGMDFAIVSDQSVIMNGSEDDRTEVESLRKRIHGDFIWFIHNGNSYVIRDAATVKAAWQLYEPVEALDRQQEALGKQQETLGKQQEEIGKKMQEIKIKVPGDLEARLKSLEAAVRNLGATASQEQLGSLQSEIGDLQSEIGNLESHAGDAEGLLGQQEGALGRKQGDLGRQQGELGREQGRLSRQASRKMQAILENSLSNGLAKRVR